MYAVLILDNCTLCNAGAEVRMGAASFHQKMRGRDRDRKRRQGGRHTEQARCSKVRACVCTARRTIHHVPSVSFFETGSFADLELAKLAGLTSHQAPDASTAL